MRGLHHPARYALRKLGAIGQFLLRGRPRDITQRRVPSCSRVLLLVEVLELALDTKRPPVETLDGVDAADVDVDRVLILLGGYVLQ